MSDDVQKPTDTRRRSGTTKGVAIERDRERRRFVVAYLAARLRGSKHPGPDAAAFLGKAKANGYADRMLANKTVREILAMETSRELRRAEITNDELLAFLKSRIFLDPAEAFDPTTNEPKAIHEIPLEVRMHIQGWDAEKKRFFFADKDNAVKIVANHLRIGLDTQAVPQNQQFFVQMVLGSLPENRRPEGWDRMGIDVREIDAVLAEKPALPAPEEEPKP